MDETAENRTTTPPPSEEDAAALSISKLFDGEDDGRGIEDY